MKRFPKILVATCAALALTSSLALAAEPAQNVSSPNMSGPNMQASAHGLHGISGAAGKGHAMAAGQAGHGKMGGMALASLSPEKQAVARSLMDAHGKALAPLHQSLYAKNAELEALNAAGEGDSAKARAVIRDLADINAKMLTLDGKFRARMVKETGLRTPVMGHGGQMGGGKMGGMSCPMMQGGMMQGGMMQGMQHGAPAPAVPGSPAPAPAPAAPAPATPVTGPATGGHDTHGN